MNTHENIPSGLPNLNDVVRRERKKLFHEYVNNPYRIRSDFNKENAELKGYHGRELLELLQNAVDALPDSGDRAVKVELRGNILLFSNKGAVFDEDGIVSILYTDNSPKYNNNKYIGNKGTGFRSVLNWAESIRIYSGDLAVEFSPRIANKFLKALSKKQTVINYINKNKSGVKLEVATLTAPKIIPPLESKDFDTVIEITAKDGVLNDIQKQLDDITASTLLFLEKLERLVLVKDGFETEYRKHRCGEKGITVIEEYKNGKLSSSGEWSVAYKIYEEGENKFAVSIAYKPDLSVGPGVLYSYFKTEITMPFPMLVHATLDLNASRNGLDKTELNRMVLGKICELMAEIAKSNYPESCYGPLRLLAPQQPLPPELAWFDFENTYLRTIAKAPLFPTVNREYISFAENPKFYSATRLADNLCGEQFNNLLIHSDNEPIRNLIKDIAEHKKMTLKFPYDEITAKINAFLPQLEKPEAIPQRAALCVQFMKEYENEIKSGIHPNFILDSDNRETDPEEQIFLPPEGGELPPPPEFTNFVFMNKQLALALKNEIDGDWRDTADRLKNLGVREYNLRTLIQGVFSKFNESGRKDNKMTIPNSIKITKWLWELSKSGRLKGENILDLTANALLLNRAGSLAPANTLYLGKEYGNDIAENIHVGNDDLFVASMIAFDVSDNEAEDFTGFLVSIGVARFPRRKSTTIEQVPEGYIDMLARERSYPLQINSNDFFENADHFKSAYIPQATVTTIEHYKTILEKAETRHILAWLKADPESLAAITAETETDSSSMGFIIWDSKREYRRLPNHLLSSYMRYVFSQSAWFSIGGQRYSPSQILFKKGIGDKLLPYAIEPDLDIHITNTHQPITEKNRIQKLLRELCASEAYAHLSTYALYGILLKLPEVDAGGRISKALYQSLMEDMEPANLDRDSPKRGEFKEKGRVFCKYDHGFVHCSKAKYLNERMVSREVQKNYSLIDIPSRRRKEAIREYLFVSDLELNGKVFGQPTPHRLNDEFQKAFSLFKNFAFCYRLDTAKPPEISRMKALKVSLCTELSADYGNGVSALDYYSFIREGDVVYLKIPSSLNSLSAIYRDPEARDAVAEIITACLNIQGAEIYANLRLLFSESLENRERMIEREFDGLDILARSKEILNSALDVREMLETVCKKFLGLPKEIKLPDEINKLLDSLDLNAYSSLLNAPIFISLLDALGLDAQDFNELSEEMIHIDLCPYFKNELEKLHKPKFTRYMDALFSQRKNESVSEQKNFIADLEKYLAYSYPCENKKDFNVEKVFREQWKIEYSGPPDAAEMAWQENKKKSEQGKDQAGLAVINDLSQSDREFKSLLYFGAFDELEIMYGKEKTSREAKAISDDAILHSTDNNNLFEPIEIEEINVTAPLSAESQPNPTGPGKLIGPGNRAAGMAAERDNFSWGALAEEIVFENLKNKYKVVEWVSENAIKKSKNSLGFAGRGYDITYEDDKGETVYVEVKSTAGNSISFVITENEINVGEREKEKYVVALVTNVEDKNLRGIKMMRGLFVYNEDEHENRFSNKRFRLSADSYTVRCIIQSDKEE